MTIHKSLLSTIPTENFQNSPLIIPVRLANESFDQLFNPAPEWMRYVQPIRDDMDDLPAHYRTAIYRRGDSGTGKEFFLSYSALTVLCEATRYGGTVLDDWDKPNQKRAYLKHYCSEGGAGNTIGRALKDARQGEKVIVGSDRRDMRIENFELAGQSSAIKATREQISEDAMRAAKTNGKNVDIKRYLENITNLWALIDSQFADYDHNA